VGSILAAVRIKGRRERALRTAFLLFASNEETPMQMRLQPPHFARILILQPAFLVDFRVAQPTRILQRLRLFHHRPLLFRYTPAYLQPNQVDTHVVLAQVLVKQASIS
jgi:hypothetical protein